MSYDIVWSEPVQEQLADQYLAARLDGREDEFSQAVSDIEAKLARDPAAFGESRGGSQRVLFDWPAMIFYQIDEPAQAVTVLAVRYTS